MLSALRCSKVPFGCMERCSLPRYRNLSSSPLYAEINRPLKAGQRKRKRTLIVDLQSLEKFQHKHGHLLVPQKFKFSEDEENMGPQGTKLGRHVHKLRDIYTESITKTEPWIVKLNSLGFEWDAHEAQFRLLMHAILAYKEVFGDFLIPTKYVIPKYSRDFSEDFRGLPIGSLYHNLLTNKITDERVAKMKKLGVPAVGIISRRAEKLLHALEVYKKLNGQTAATLRIPIGYAVNIYDEEWPEELWGYKLYHMAYNARIGGLEEFHPQLAAAGLKIWPKEKIAERDERIKKAKEYIKKVKSELLLADSLAES